MFNIKVLHESAKGCDSFEYREYRMLINMKGCPANAYLDWHLSSLCELVAAELT